MATLPEALKSITATKITELKKQRENFEVSRTRIEQDAPQSPSMIRGVQSLLKGTCRLHGLREETSSDSEEDVLAASTDTNRRELYNKRALLAQAVVDPSFPQVYVKTIGAELSASLQLQSLHNEHAQFFSELVTESLSNPDVLSSKNQFTPDDSGTFDHVGRKEMHEQRAQWEELVFSESSVNEAQLRSYLTSLYESSKKVSIPFEEMKRKIKEACNQIEYGSRLFDSDSLKLAIKGVIATDLLSEDKIAILKTFLNNKEVLSEVADVLNMRVASLDTWEWSTMNAAITVVQRRQLNGKYRVFADEDILDAILIHAIGMKFAVSLRGAFSSLFNSHAWERQRPNLITKNDRERREYFLETSQPATTSIDSTRRETYATDYFMTQLPVSESEGPRAYDDSDDEEDASLNRKSPLEIKHGLLHLLITESLIHRHLHPEQAFTIIRSDFKWYGPSLPHASICTVLAFFGFTAHWIKFFKKFLAMPLRFEQDGKNGQVNLRKRGVPISHSLSDVFSESILFVMDFAVNQVAPSSYLYRLHDDFWFWGPRKTCVSAWTAMEKFASTMGIEFNMEKTGSVELRGTVGTDDDELLEPRKTKRLSLSKKNYSTQIDAMKDESTRTGAEDEENWEDEADCATDVPTSSIQGSLPEGDVRWGFLKLDANQGRFVLDGTMLEEHIKELRHQLSCCNSVFSYIRAYNTYMRFFQNNFGKPATAFGRKHIDDMLDALSRVQNELYPKAITQHLREVVKSKFEVEELPDGFFYWPNELGGLELRNPFTSLCATRASIRRTPEKVLEKALIRDDVAYQSAKASFERGGSNRFVGKYNYDLRRKLDVDRDHFMSKEEYLRHRELYSTNLGMAYRKLLSVPEEISPKETPEITAWLKALEGPGAGRSKESFRARFDTMSPYWQWTLVEHGSDIVEKYGSVRIVDRNKIPVGIVSVLKAAKVRWSG